tara:strand:- start:10584 stop:11627 length:1044 start_codon:yes stop_codon:yes gene_type:complete
VITEKVRQWQGLLQKLVTGFFAVGAMLCLLATVLWRDRIPLDEILLSPAPLATRETPVTVTWFGVTTLLFDDGETQLLIDGFVSRPTLADILLDRPVNNDAAKINYFLNEYEINRLAAIIPAHSHFDHAMDIAAIANRSSASILGSESSAHIGRGAGVPPDQIVVVADGADYTFGEFSVRFIATGHAPVGWRGAVPLPGAIESPLRMPAPVSAFREGGSYAIVVSHPSGSALVLGSAGLQPGKLDNLQVDTVFLGVGMIEGLGQAYIQDYWKYAVTATGAKTVVPVHFDDYTQPFGNISLAPKVLDDFSVTARVLQDSRKRWDADTQLFMPAFAVPMPLTVRAAPET